MSKRLSKRVLLFGWDAADWQMINPLLEAGQMPHLRRLIETGVMGKIATLYPIISPILWNSIATGKRADKHGILGFVEPNGQGGIRPVASTSRRSKAIWNILSQNGLRSCVVGWYASHPAERINGVVVTDRYQHTAVEQADRYPLDAASIHPAARFDELLDLRVTQGEITAEQVLPFIPRADLIKQPDDLRLPALTHLLAECATIHNAATHLIEREAWDFMAVYYDAIDHFGHGFMEYHPPKMGHLTDEEFEIYQHVMNGCYRFHDMMLGRLIELAGAETTIILMSDHGFFSDDLRPGLRSDPVDPKRKVGPGRNPVAWHRPYGVLAINGPAIKNDELVHGASLLDIAPTVLALLGLPIPADMDGKPLTQVLTEPVELDRIATYEVDHPDDGVHRGEHVEDPYAAQLVLKQLAELGYIEAPGGDQAKAVDRTIKDHRHNLAQVHFAAGRMQQAHDVLKELLADDDSAHLRSRLAMCLITMNRLSEAEPILESLAGRPEEFPLANLLWGQLKFARREYFEALRLFEKVRELNPRMPHLHAYMGRVHLATGQHELAEAAFRRTLDIDGDDAEAHDGLGVALYHQGRYDDALYEHMTSAALLHHRPETHINLGIAAAKLKQIDWAIRAFKVAAELAPDHPHPHRCLAQIYRRAKGDYDAALYHAQIAMRLRGEHRRKQAAAAK